MKTTSSTENPELTVWIRAGGPEIKKEIPSFVQKVLESLPQHVPSQVLVCTNENDPIVEELGVIKKTCKNIKVIFSQLSSFSSALTALAQNTNPESNALSLSVGVNVRKDQIESGLKALTGRVKVYGWSIKVSVHLGSGLPNGV